MANKKPLSRQIVQAISKRQLAWAAEQFKLTGNPLYAWNAINMAMNAGARLPAAVRAYLLRVARSLGNLKAEPGRDIARYVLQAVELRTDGGPSYFAQRKKREKLRAVVHRAALLAKQYEGEKAAPSRSFDDALERAAMDADMDADSIKRQARRQKRRTKQA